jgi:hypothetical protein
MNKGAGKMVRDEDLLRSAKHGKARAGKRELIKWLEGDKLTWGKAIKAKCYDCSGMGDSGECDLESCPLLPFSPYNSQRKAHARARNAKRGTVGAVANPEKDLK